MANFLSRAKSEPNAAHGNVVKGETGSNGSSIAPKLASEDVSCLGSAILVKGNIVCKGATEIFGRVIGDIEAERIVIGDSAEVEGNIKANDVGIAGKFKGTVRGTYVRLRGAAIVEGEIFSKSLTVEENVRFDGLSRRLDSQIEPQPSVPTSSEG